ncbi:MFS transporter [Brachybacterium phenoliresistens]|uniref:MFS transporter n=1 Tax=Brachybacterium phenoliresistens TaxID=396014 RepID=UPI0031E31604
MTEKTGAAGGGLSARRRWAVLGVCALALFLVGLDTTIVTVGLPEIGRGLGIEGHRLAWVVDAYTVVFAGLLISSGALADRFGRRRVFRTGLITVAAASLACAAAPAPGILVAARAVQGAGASMLSPVALAIVVNAMPDPRGRASAIGVWGAVFGLSMAVGPVAGGALLALLDWRALFWINVPVVLVALLLVAAVVPESRGRRARRLDPVGQVLLVLILVLGVALLIEGRRLGWGSPWAILGYGALVALSAAFVLGEARRREPLIEPSLFRSPQFAGAVLAAVAVFLAFSMTLLMSTALLQETQGWSPLDAGAVILPMALGATVCAPLSGALVGRIGPRPPLLIAGSALTAGGVLFLLTTRPTALLALGQDPSALLLLSSLLVGIGVGFANAPITSTAVGTLSSDRAGVAGGIASTARQVGTAIGIALAGTLVVGPAAGGVAPSTVAGWIVVIASGAVVLLIAVGADGGAAVSTRVGAGDGGPGADPGRPGSAGQPARTDAAVAVDPRAPRPGQELAR